MKDDLIYPLRIPRPVVVRMEAAIAAGAAASKAEFVRNAIELALQAYDPRVKSTMAALLVQMVKGFAPALQTAFEQISPDMIAQLEKLDASLVADHFSKMFGLSEHTKHALDKEIDRSKREGRRRKTA